MLPLDNVSDNLKISILKKIKRKDFVKLHRTCKSMNYFLLEYGYLLRFELDDESDIEIYVKDSILYFKLPNRWQNTEFVAVDIIDWITPFRFKNCNLQMESPKTNRDGSLEAALSLLKKSLWTGFSNKLSLQDINKEILVDFVRIIKPKDIYYVQRSKQLEPDHLSHPIFSTIEELDIMRCNDGRSGDPLNMLEVIKNIKFITFAFLTWEELLQMYFIIQNWSSGLETGKLFSITFDYLPELTLEQSYQLDRLLEDVEPFWIGKNAMGEHGISTLWILRRTINEKEEFALVVYCKWKQTTGIFIISHDWTDLINQISIEMRESYDNARDKLKNFLGQ